MNNLKIQNSRQNWSQKHLRFIFKQCVENWTWRTIIRRSVQHVLIFTTTRQMIYSRGLRMNHSCKRWMKNSSACRRWRWRHSANIYTTRHRRHCVQTTCTILHLGWLRPSPLIHALSRIATLSWWSLKYKVSFQRKWQFWDQLNSKTGFKNNWSLRTDFTYTLVVSLEQNQSLLNLNTSHGRPCYKGRKLYVDKEWSGHFKQIQIWSEKELE